MKLIYHEDFWTFYMNNRVDIDHIINSTSKIYKKYIEQNEMFQEIIYRLAKNQVLKNWNVRKSVLNTYITMKIRFYARHIMSKHINKYYVTLEGTNIQKETNTQKETKTQLPKYINVERYTSSLVYEDEIERTSDSYRPYSIPTINRDIYCHELMAILKEELNSIEYLIACMYMLDSFTRHEISDAIQVSYTTILKKIQNIKTIIHRVNNMEHKIL